MNNLEVKVTKNYDELDDAEYCTVSFQNENMHLTFGEPYLISNEKLLKLEKALNDNSISESIGGGGNSCWKFSVSNGVSMIEIDISGNGEDLFSAFKLTREQAKTIIEELLKIDKI